MLPLQPPTREIWFFDRSIGVYGRDGLVRKFYPRTRKEGEWARLGAGLGGVSNSQLAYGLRRSTDQ